MFGALALHLHSNKKLEEEISKVLNVFLNNSEERDVSKFQGVHLNDIPKVEDLLQLRIFLYYFDFLDGELIGELCRRSIQKYEKSVKLLCYHNHVCYVNNINALFEAFRCTTCDTFFSKTGNLQRHLVTCSDRVNHIYPKNVYELTGTPFEKLDAFNIPFINDQKMFKNLAIFYFESICDEEEDAYKQTETTTWMGKLVPMLVSISSNLIPEPNFLCNANLDHIILSFITALEGLATQSSDEIEFYWSRDCKQDNTVCYTGTTQPMTQSSREGVKLCIWLHRWGVNWFIYTIPATAKESKNWLTGFFWALM